jgi:hypothetical protein
MTSEDPAPNAGTAEAASNVETTLTQLTQHYSILAQVRAQAQAARQPRVHTSV